MRRREFLTVSAASAALAALGETSGAVATAPTTPTVADGFSRAQFAAWLDEDFDIRAHGSLRCVRAQLTAVEDRLTAPGLEQFSVVFRGVSALPRGSCWLSRSDGTQFTLHLQGTKSPLLRRANFALLETRHV
jgi:hypothetical protein